MVFNQFAANANNALEPPLRYPGATPDAERAQKPLCLSFHISLPERSLRGLILRMSLTKACSPSIGWHGLLGR